MTEHPLLLNAQMVRAVLAGHKTQTRRVMRNQSNDDWCINQKTGAYRKLSSIIVPLGENEKAVPFFEIDDVIHGIESQKSPFGKSGDSLWVREACRAVEQPSGLDGIQYLADDCFVPIADTLEAADNWVELNNYRGKRGAVIPSIHMPRHASRINLRVVRVWAERLQDISEADALAEGVTQQMRSNFGWEAEESVESFNARQAKDTFKLLWQSIYGDASWTNENPWVWCCEFSVIKK